MLSSLASPAAQAANIDTSGAGTEDNMKRPTKKSSGAQTNSTQRTTHLDLQSHDDMGSSAKIHPKKKGTSMSALAVTVLCGLVALGTLFYVSNKVFSQGPNTMVGTNGAHRVTSGSDLLSQANSMAQLPPDSIYRTKVMDIKGDWQELKQYSGGVSLIVNVACE